MNGVTRNQITTLSQAGYLTAPVNDIHTLPAYAAATNSNYSLEYRVRSYLAVNCVQCHQPGGAGPGTWDARSFVTLDQTGLVLGQPNDNGGDPANKLIVPGDPLHSVLLARLQVTNNFARMPPLATHQLDVASIQLVQSWIAQELTSRLTYDQWRTQQFQGATGSETVPSADPDGDGASNLIEFLTRTDPQDPQSAWKLALTVGNGQVAVTYQQVPNLGLVIDTSNDLITWRPWDVAGNAAFFSSAAGPVSLYVPQTGSPGNQYFRARFILP